MSYADTSANYEKAMALRNQMANRAAGITPEIADLLGRAYALNRNLNPEVTTSLVLAGAPENVVWEANREATLRMLKDRISLTPFAIGREDGRYPSTITEPSASTTEEEDDDGGGFWSWAGDRLGDIAGGVSTGSKWLVRGALAVGDTAVQETQNVASTFVPGSPNSVWTDIREGNWSDLLSYRANNLQATTLGQVAADVIAGRKVDLGSGYFPAGETVERRAQAERDYRGMVNGSAWTIGRGAANLGVEFGVWNRDSRMYAIASGMIDAAVAIGADVTNYIPLTGWGDETVEGMRAVRSMRASKVADALDLSRAAEAAGDFAEAKRYHQLAQRLLGASGDVRRMSPKNRAWRAAIADEIGLVSTGGIKTVTTPDMLHWLVSGRGRRLAEAIAEETDPGRIWRLHNKKIRPWLAQRLAEADSPMAVAETLARAMDTMEDGQAAIRAVPGIGRAMMPNLGLDIRQRFNSVSRIGNLFPGATTLDPTDEIGSLNRLDTMLSTLASKTRANGKVKARGARYDMETRNELINKGIAAFADGRPAALFGFYNEVATHFKDTLVGLGWHPEDAAAATEWSKQLGRLQEYTSYELMSGIDPVPYAIGGKTLPIDPNQLLSGGVNVIDQSALFQAVREQGRISTVLRQATKDPVARARLRSIAGPDALTGGNLAYRLERMPRVALDSFFSGIWKGVTLLKIGYITKVVPEEMSRVMASGVFENPVDMMLAALRQSYRPKRVREFMRYQVDAMDRSFNAWKQYDAIVNMQDELMERAGGLLKAGDQAGHDALVKQARDLDGEIDKLMDDMESLDGNFVQAQIGTRPDAAKESITKDTTRHYARGAWLQADKATESTRRQYIEGLHNALRGKASSWVDRRIANRAPFDGDKLTLNGVYSTWAEHVAAGRNVRQINMPRLENAVNNIDDAVTGSPLDAVMFRGEGGVNVVGSGDNAILGPALYVTPDETYAKSFARDYGASPDPASGEWPVVGQVVQRRVQLSNPLVVKSDSEWRQITDAAGLKFPKPGNDRAQFSDTLRRHIESQGYDGVVIQLPRKNGSVGDSVLNDLFSGDQVIAFNAAAGNQPTSFMTGDDGIVEWLLNGDGNEWLQSYVTKTAGIDGSWNWATRQGIEPLLQRKYRDIAYLTGADETAATALRLDNADPELLEYIATGRFRGSRAEYFNKKTRTKLRTDEWNQKLEEFRQADVSPGKIHYNAALEPPTAMNGEISRIWQKFLSAFFQGMYGKSSDLLSRSPSFRRIYWKNMSALLPAATANDAALILARAEKAGLPASMMADLRLRARLANGTSAIDDLDATAKGFALDKVQDLLFDATKKGAGMDQMRLILPFGDAYKEVFTSWTKIMVKRKGRPAKSLAKGIRGMQGAVGVGPGDVDGDGNDDGFMWKNPVTDEWMFSVPFSQKLVDAAVGTDYPGVGFGIEARSLNVLGNVMPGIGPISDQIVAGVVPKTGQFDKVRKLLFPYGEPMDPEAPMSGNLVQRLVFPAWARRAASGDFQDLPFGVGALTSYVANMVNDRENDPSYQVARNHVAKQLATERNHDGSLKYPQTSEGMARLRADAETVAQRITMMRGIIGFFTPAAPLPQYMAETQAGDVRAALLTQELRDNEQQYLEAGEPIQNATIDLLNKYGPGVWLYASSNSKTKFPGIEATKEWWDWWRENQDVTDAYPEVGAFFGPAGESFDIEIYGQQSSRGLRMPDPVEDMIRKQQEKNMVSAYYRFRDDLDADGQRTEVETQALSAYKEQLTAQYGFELQSVLNSKSDLARNQIARLEEMLTRYGDDPIATRVLDSATGQTLIDYMTARQVVIEEAESRGVPSGWYMAKSTYDLRVALRSLGSDLAASDLGFARMWEEILRNEMVNDDEEPLAAAPKPAPAPSGVRTTPIPTG